MREELITNINAYIYYLISITDFAWQFQPLLIDIVFLDRTLAIGAFKRARIETTSSSLSEGVSVTALGAVGGLGASSAMISC